MAEHLPLWLRLARLLINEARPSMKDAVLGVLVFFFGAFFKVKSGDLTASLTWRNIAGALFPIIAALMVFLILHTIRAAKSLIALLKAEQVEEEYNPYPSIVVPEPITEKRLKGTPYFRSKTIALAALFIITFSMIGVTSWYATAAVDRIFQERQSVIASPAVTPSPSGLALPAYNDLPIVVNAAINWKKEFRMANHGEIPIYDIQMRGTEYILDEVAFGQNRVEIKYYHVYSTTSGQPNFWIQQLGAHQYTPIYDLAQHYKFVDFPQNDQKGNRPNVAEWACRNYVLRITFRDARTGIRYVSYKTVGSIRGFEMFENRETAGESGGVNRQFTVTIPAILISHQKQMFPLAAYERDYPLPQ